jgi:hypothetical protein
MAKSKGRGGRRMGAGRPRSTPAGKNSYFSTRIDAETRAWLEAESRRTNKTLSSTVAHLLRFALQKREQDDRADPIRALCYVIGVLAERIPATYFTKREYSWRSNPYMFEAFRTAVLHLLDEWRPAGEIVTPPPLHPTFKSTFKEDPVQHGLEIARGIIFQLQSAALLAKSPEEELPEWNVYTLSRLGLSVDKFSDALLEQQYNLAHAGRALTALPPAKGSSEG